MEKTMKRSKMRVLIVLLSLTVLTLSACSLTNFLEDLIGTQTDSAEEQVSATLQALESDKAAGTPQEATPTIEETQPSKGTISGEITYPSEFLPPQRIVAFDVNDMNTHYMTEVHSGVTYSLELPPGTYYVLAYVIDLEALGATPGLSGAYSQAVLCGLQYGCDDHSLVPVQVNAGQTMAGIDPVDWYLPPGEDAGWPSDPAKAGTGAISGDLGFPSEYIPPLRVVAFNIYTDHYFYVDTLLNQSTYQIDNLPPGTYRVVAFVREDGPDFSGGYSHFVTCGMTVDCNNHNLIDVNVYAGQVTEDIDPIDFYAQPGEADWPEDPTQ